MFPGSEGETDGLLDAFLERATGAQSRSFAYQAERGGLW
jgi:hypothetical protein